MASRSPLGSNYGWYVTTDHMYSPRDVNVEIHSTIALTAVSMDTKLMALRNTLGHPVALGVTVGKTTMHIRAYDFSAAKSRSDQLTSRLATVDSETVTYMTFNEIGGLEVLVGKERLDVAGHTPLFHASRVLSPTVVQTLNNLQGQFTGKPVIRLGTPETQPPLDTEEIIDLYATEPPTLE